MKALKQGAALLLAVLLLLAAIPAALAAENASAQAGQTAVLTFRFPEVVRLDGSFSVEDPSGIAASHTISVSDTAGVSVAVDGDRVWAAPSGEPEKTTVTVTVSVTLKAGASAGKSCTVTFAGHCGSDETAPDSLTSVTQSATVTVKAKKIIVTDYSALNAQLAAAEALAESDYTAASWAAFSTAVTEGRAAGNSKEQKSVDAAARSIQQAAAALVPMDRAVLQAALEAVEELADVDDFSGDWLALADAVRVGQALLGSTDQSAVDAATAQISEALSRVEEQLAALRAPVEEPAEKPDCVVSTHRVWPVLLAVSGAVNVFLLVVLFLQKKNKVTDDTPLVDYDIGDDLL